MSHCVSIANDLVRVAGCVVSSSLWVVGPPSRRPPSCLALPCLALPFLDTRHSPLPRRLSSSSARLGCLNMKGGRGRHDGRAGVEGDPPDHLLRGLRQRGHGGVEERFSEDHGAGRSVHASLAIGGQLFQGEHCRSAVGVCGRAGYYDAWCFAFVLSCLGLFAFYSTTAVDVSSFL